MGTDSVESFPDTPETGFFVHPRFFSLRFQVYLMQENQDVLDLYFCSCGSFLSLISWIVIETSYQLLYMCNLRANIYGQQFNGHR